MSKQKSLFPDLDRFFSKIEIINNGCWIWKGATITNRRGLLYGRFWYKGKACLAHRISLILHGFKVPKQMVVSHKICDTTLCVKPTHIRVVTQIENIKDQKRKGRYWRDDESGRFSCPEEADTYYADFTDEHIPF